MSSATPRHTPRVTRAHPREGRARVPRVRFGGRLRGLAAGALLALVGGGLTPAGAATPPPGYYIRTFTAAVPYPTSLAFAPDGWLYVASLHGRVEAHRDLNGDGISDTSAVYATGLNGPLGLALRDGAVYVSTVGKVTRYRDLDGDHVADVADTLITGLPYGQHQNSGIAFGPDSLLYVTVGTATSTGVQTHPWSGTILRFTPGGGFVDVFAGGFRNPYDLAFHADRSLFAADNSPSGDSTWTCYAAPDELNWIQAGGNYGFPYCFGTGDCADVGDDCAVLPCGDGDCNWESGCKGWMTPPLWLFDTHSSPDGLTFGDGFEGYGSDDLFVAQWGQDVPLPGCSTAYGHQVVRVEMHRQPNGDWVVAGEVPFVTGMRSPLDVTVGPDGALYVADFFEGRVYRVAYATGTGVGEGRTDAGSRPRLAFTVSANPARDPVALHWTALPEAGRVTVAVFDVAGRKVADLGSFTRPSELPRMGWSLRDASGRRVPAGLYLIRAAGGDGAAAARILVMP